MATSEITDFDIAPPRLTGERSWLRLDFTQRFQFFAKPRRDRFLGFPLGIGEC